MCVVSVVRISQEFFGVACFRGLLVASGTAAAAARGQYPPRAVGCKPWLDGISPALLLERPCVKVRGRIPRAVCIGAGSDRRHVWFAKSAHLGRWIHRRELPEKRVRRLSPTWRSIAGRTKAHCCTPWARSCSSTATGSSSLWDHATPSRQDTGMPPHSALERRGPLPDRGPSRESSAPAHRGVAVRRGYADFGMMSGKRGPTDVVVPATNAAMHRWPVVARGGLHRVEPVGVGRYAARTVSGSLTGRLRSFSLCSGRGAAW